MEGREKELLTVIFLVVAGVYSVAANEDYRHGKHTRRIALLRIFCAWIFFGALLFLIWSLG